MKSPISYILILTLIPFLEVAKCQETAKTPCTLVMELAGSARKCLSQNNGSSNSIINLDSPKEVIAVITDANRRACLVKCVMLDRGFINAEGQMNSGALLANQEAFPVEMKEKLTIEALQPCLEMAVKFDPASCTTYYEFSQCFLGVIVKAFDPSALDCFTKTPGAGPLFALLQSALENRAANNGTGFFTRMRDRVSTGVGDVRDRVADWIKKST